MLKKVHRNLIRLELLSGMHITGSDDMFDIGGADSQVIKNPITNEPYIPGSSIKGKLRSLLEYKYGKIVDKDIKITDEHAICLNLFEPIDTKQPMRTRGIFRDLLLTEESKEKLNAILGDNIFTEIKAENKIGRFSGKADSPRFIERVPAGSVFEGYIDVLEFDGDDYNLLFQYLNEAIELLNYNYIGGSGTRGYGRVNITIEELKNE